MSCCSCVSPRQCKHTFLLIGYSCFFAQAHSPPPFTRLCRTPTDHDPVAHRFENQSQWLSRFEWATRVSEGNHAYHPNWKFGDEEAGSVLHGRRTRKTWQRSKSKSRPRRIPRSRATRAPRSRCAAGPPRGASRPCRAVPAELSPWPDTRRLAAPAPPRRRSSSVPRSRGQGPPATRQLAPRPAAGGECPWLAAVG